MSIVYPDVVIPKHNPVRLVRVPGQRFWHQNIPYFENAEIFLQKFQFGDIIYIQLAVKDPDLLTYNPTARLYNCAGDIVHTFTINATATAYQYAEYTNYNIYEAMPVITAGTHTIRIELPLITGTYIYESEPLDIQRLHPETIWLEYRNALTNDFYCIFTDVLGSFGLRIFGGLPSDGFLPGGKYKLHIDQEYTPVMLHATPFNTYKFVFGDPRGMPGWLGEKINLAFALDTVQIDGVLYMRNENAKMERNGGPGMPMAGWSLELLAVNNYDETGMGGGDPPVSLTVDTTLITCDSDEVSCDQTKQ